jgi:hypothetical protein
MVKLRFASDDDCLRYEPSLDSVWPRTDKSGNVLHDWDVQHQIAMDEIDRRLRARKDVPEQFELGRVGLRSREQLRDCAARLALHYIFVAADTQGRADDYYSRRASYHYEGATAILNDVAMAIDYDLDNSGDVDNSEKNQPFQPIFYRG